MFPLPSTKTVLPSLQMPDSPVAASEPFGTAEGFHLPRIPILFSNYATAFLVA